MAKAFIFLGVNLNKVRWPLILYVLFSIVFLFATTMQLYPMGTTRTVIYSVGTLLVLIFYGYRWFGNGTDADSDMWPPVINTCPDYLTYVDSLPGDNSQGCVDMLGVSTNGAFKRSLPSDIIEGGNLSSKQVDRVIPFTAEDVTGAADASTIQTVCNLCRRMGLTWEGIYDGDVCVGIHSAKKIQESQDNGRCA